MRPGQRVDKVDCDVLHVLGYSQVVLKRAAWVRHGQGPPIAY